MFAGAGGWDEGVRPLGFAPLGIELDEAACLTREAVGHPTLRGDVAELDPLRFAPCDLLIASPPCQAFSAAGKGDGRLDVPAILRVADGFDRGDDLRSDVVLNDSRSLLVVEPLRWTLALRPTFVALEQVPPVLDLWRHFARILERHGYWTWAGLLSAERYGVPQTRSRAFLMASLAGPVDPPAPTHQEYRPGVPACEQHTLEGTLLPWVSMAEALGWGMTDRPTVTVLGASNNGGRAGIDGGAGSRATVERERERERGAWRDREHAR